MKSVSLDCPEGVAFLAMIRARWLLVMLAFGLMVVPSSASAQANVDLVESFLGAINSKGSDLAFDPMPQSMPQSVCFDDEDGDQTQGRPPVIT